MTQRILVVDDDQSIRESFERQLRLLGYAPAVAESAEAAMRLLQSSDPAIVITDVRMPNASGLELLSWLRERAPEIDVIVMTAHQDMESALRAMKGGAYDYLVKPLDLDQIELVLARCVRDRGWRRRAHRLAAEAAEPYQLGHLVGRDPRMIEISKLIASVATARMPVLIRGETGTGKEVIAKTIHYNSAEADEPFVAVNCTAVPESLLESELFGHVRGAFTGAISDRKGRFELASDGTIFLDEIGDVTPTFQAKLLRVLQDGEFYPVGAEQPEKTGARVIAATHRDLERLVTEGKFREDLYYRLRIVEIVVPPLRERAGDIPELARFLVRRAAASSGHTEPVIGDDAMAALVAHEWRGNVRELENCLTRATVLAAGNVVRPEHLSLSSDGERVSAKLASLEEVERDQIVRVLAYTAGQKTAAAKILGVSRPRLDRLLVKHRLE